MGGKCNIQTKQIKFTTMTGEEKVYPLMKIKISGKLGISDIGPIMNDIREATKKQPTPYVTNTDLRDLDINKTFESLIFLGMEKFYNKLLSVENPSKYSFVLLDNDTKRHEKSMGALEMINKNREKNSDPIYNYIFITEEGQITKILSELES